MVTTPDIDDLHLLIVTGESRERLYRRFAGLYAHVTDVRVVKDRRYSERRRTLRTVGQERRSSDRRRHRPEWVFPPEVL